MAFSSIIMLPLLLLFLAIWAGLIYLLILLIRALRKYLRGGEARREKAETCRTLGEVLKAHRMRCQMTQEFVAEALGVSRQAVSKWETGTADPSTSNLLALAKLFGVPAEELLRETRGELCELSLAIAEKVIHVSLNSSSEVVARMIQVATEKLKRREWVHIYVGGCAAKEVSAITPELMTALAGLSDHIKIIPLSDDEAGTCIIEMPDEIIDASASTQLKNIRDLIHEI